MVQRGVEPPAVTLGDGLPGLLSRQGGIGLDLPGPAADQEVGLGYIGFSHHNVPSLSNVAIRSPAGTNASPGSITDRTKSSTAVLAAPSRQLGSAQDDVMKLTLQTPRADALCLQGTAGDRRDCYLLLDIACMSFLTWAMTWASSAPNTAPLIPTVSSSRFGYC